MSKAQQPGAIESAFLDNDYETMLHAVGAKLARRLDKCESSRDCRPLANGLLEVTERLQHQQAVNDTDTPLDRILREAEQLLKDGTNER